MRQNRFCNLSFFQILSAVMLLTCGVAVASDAHGPGKHRSRIIGAYFEEWSIYGANYNVADIQSSQAADVLTHLLYAFADVSPSGQCALADSWADYQDPYLPSVTGQPYTGPLYGNFGALLQLKRLHPNLKVLISIGGASAANTAGFSAAAATPAGRSALASSCVDTFIKGDVAQGVSAAGVFDGIDIDWEFPGAADKENFTALVAEFRKQLAALGTQQKTEYLLTIAAPAGSQNYSNMELDAVAAQLDFLNVETYDYHGTWETTTNHAAPLLESASDPAHGQGLYIDATVGAYLEAGVPAFKLVLGIPAYGRGWSGVPDQNNGLYQRSVGAAPSPSGDSLATDGTATYRTLKTFGSEGFTSYHDLTSLADWLYNSSTKTFWTYDGPASVMIKTTYAKLRAGGLGGAFEWALKDDDENAALLKTISKGLDPRP